jgi:ubiquinone/menaquinone biosynthesis C-methylase UbiE
MSDATPTDPPATDPRLAATYDAFEGERDDLDAYVRLLAEHGARRVVDLGCGTGTLALRLMAHDDAPGAPREVLAIDPDPDMLDVARGKSGAGRVRWLLGTSADAPSGWADAVTMTANVAQVFLGDEEWAATLSDLHRSLRPGGLLAVEARRPEDRAWERWAERYDAQEREIDGVGRVTDSFEVLDVALPLVSFRFTSHFHSDGSDVASDSTLRFRTDEEIAADLAAAGFEDIEVRDHPTAPGRGYLFLARRG